MKFDIYSFLLKKIDFGKFIKTRQTKIIKQPKNNKVIKYITWVGVSGKYRNVTENTTIFTTRIMTGTIDLNIYIITNSPQLTVTIDQLDVLYLSFLYQVQLVQ
jgi:secreted protein with Ig-like and vWFA domain